MTTVRFADSRKSALLMILLMIGMSQLPVLASQADGKQAPTGNSWPLEGSEDTGWVLLETHGANPIRNQPAFANWDLTFPPGAQVSNVTLEVGVDGDDGVSILDPELYSPDTQYSFFDWSNLGGFGYQDGFLTGEEYSGRLSPNSDIGAMYRLPAGAEVTDLVLEALRPVDPAVSFIPLDLDITDSEVDQSDGRLYIAVGDVVLQLDHHIDPKVIFLRENLTTTDIHIDSTMQRLLIVHSLGISAYDIDDGQYLGELPDHPSTTSVNGGADVFTHVYSTSNALYGISAAGLMRLNAAGSAWTSEQVSGTNTWPAGIPQDVEFVGGVLYVSIMGGGVARWDSASNSALNPFQAASGSDFTSNQVHTMVVESDMLYIASTDAGLFRYSHTQDAWLSPWTHNNWLDDNMVKDLAVVDDSMFILGPDTLHQFDINLGLITQDLDVRSDLGLARDAVDVIPWTATGGPRGPPSSIALLGDGTGMFSVLDPQAQMLYSTDLELASGPSGMDMTNVVQIQDQVFVASGDIIDVFNSTAWKWTEPMTGFGQDIVSMTTDGSLIYLATEYPASIVELHPDGTWMRIWGGGDLAQDEVWDVEYDNTGYLVITHWGEVTVIDLLTSSSSYYAWDVGQFNDVVSRDGIAYLATDGAGIFRLELATGDNLAPWQSTGLDDLESIPIAAGNGMIYIGVPSVGVMVFDQTSTELLETWKAVQGGTGGGGSGELPGDYVTALHVDIDGYVWVGTSEGGVRYDGQDFDELDHDGEWWQGGMVDIDSDASNIWAAMTGAEICKWDRQSLLGGQASDCFDDDDGLPQGDDGYWDYLDVRFINTNELMLSTINGAATFDTSSMQVLDSWDSNSVTEDAPVIQFGDVIYLALLGDGIARYDTAANQWLSSWDSSNLLPDDYVTAMALDRTRTTLWAGSESGLTEIDLVSGTSTSTMTVSGLQPQSLIIDDDILYYIPWQDENDDDIQRLDLTSNTLLSAIDVGGEFGDDAYIHGVDIIDGTLLIGASEAEWRWWVGYDEGRILRFDIASDSWDTAWQPSAFVGRVNTAYIGGHVYIAYGNDVIRELNANGFLLNEWIDLLEGPIRGIVEYNGEILFGTSEGIARYDSANEVWLTTWTPDNLGMHPDAEWEVTTLEVEAGELWYGTGIRNWWGSTQTLQRATGSDVNGDGLIDGNDHDSWEAGSQGIPDGDFWDLEMCAGYMHVATRWNGNFGNGGGVGRFDTTTDSWTTNVWTQGNGLSDDDAVGLACDSQEIMYIGFQDPGHGISRFDYSTGHWIADLTAADGISEDPVWWGAMEWMNGELMIGHTLEDNGQGGFSTIQTNGASTSNGVVLSQGAEVSSITPVSNAPFGTGFILGRPGTDQGNSAVDWYSNGQVNRAYFDSMVGFTTGIIEEFEGNSTHVYIVPANDRFNNMGTSILEGQYMQNGSVIWTRGWAFSYDVIKDIHFDGSYIWVTTAGLGLWYIDVNSGTMARVSASLTTTMDGLSMEGSSLAVGLTSSGTSVPGTQILNTTSMQWEAGGLVPGLPSNIILDAVVHQGKTWFATLNGVGVWDNTAGEWEQALTVANGLPTPVVEEFYIHSSGELWMATPVGIVRYDSLTDSYQPTIDRLDGLIGNRVNNIAEDGGQLFLSHNGAGPTRPGASALDYGTLTVDYTVALDQLPSNVVTALAVDSWGVHIATDQDPLVHYNMVDNRFEEGISSWRIGVWPAIEMVSDGNDLFALFSDRVIRIDAQGTTHSARDGWNVEDVQELSLGGTGLFAVGAEGMFGWSSAPYFIPMERFQLRYADPLMVNFAGISIDITDSTHPGQTVVMASASNTLTTDATVGSNDVATMIYADLAIALTSPVSYSPTYLRSNQVLYQGEWELTQTNKDIEFELQQVLDTAVINAQGMDVELRLKSALNGSMMVRLTYDWVRIQTPVEVLDLVDRPEDGGGYLTASWTVSPDPDFAAYHLYIVQPDKFDIDLDQLSSQAPDVTSAAWGRTSIDVGTSMGMPLIDGEEYSAVIVVEYADGSMGEPSNMFGPAIPFDDVPSSPEWGIAVPAADGTDGDLDVEWSRCMAIDLEFTRIHIYTQPVTDALATTTSVDIDGDSPNSTTLQLDAGRPYWLALTCVDLAGQENLAEPLIIGPVVPTGGIDDGVPPPKILGVNAFDTPDDEGGRITVGWIPSIADDCAFTTVYIIDSELWMGWDIDPVTGEDVRTDVPLTASELGIGEIITDCSINGTIISSVDGEPLVDGNLYYVAVVAADKWLNEDLLNVDIVEVTPYRQQAAGSTPPDRVGFLDAWDKPADDGTAIQVVWSPSFANDFAYYIIWANSEPVDDLQDLWNFVGDDQINCGCVRVNQQFFGSSDEAIEITMDRARYGPAGNSLTSDEAMQKGVIPGIPLYITVTIHDVKGNVWLTDLPVVETLPVNNIDDDIPPGLLEDVMVEDWPEDDGSAVSLEFYLGPESDIDQYAVYASSEQFTQAGFGGPADPVMFLDRAPAMPIQVSHLSNGEAIIAEMTVWVGVIAIDSAGNSVTTGLYTSSAIAKDNRGEDPGAYLPDVENVRASWILSGNAIMIEWDEMDDAEIDHIEIYVSNENWETTLDATFVGSAAIGDEAFVLLEMDGESLDNLSDWYIGVSAADELTHRHMVKLVHVNAYGSDGGDGSSQGGAPEWQAVVSNPNILLTAFLMLAIAVVLLMIFRSRRRRSDAQWQFEGTWGIKQPEPTDLWGDAPQSVPSEGVSRPLESAPAGGLLEMKQDPMAQQQTFSAPDSTVAPETISAIESELVAQPQQSQSNIDTSFLDDLL